MLAFVPCRQERRATEVCLFLFYPFNYSFLNPSPIMFTLFDIFTSRKPQIRIFPVSSINHSSVRLNQNSFRSNDSIVFPKRYPALLGKVREVTKNSLLDPFRRRFSRVEWFLTWPFRPVSSIKSRILLKTSHFWLQNTRFTQSKKKEWPTSWDRIYESVVFTSFKPSHSYPRKSYIGNKEGRARPALIGSRAERWLLLQ